MPGVRGRVTKKIAIAAMLALGIAAPAGAQITLSGWGTAVIDGVIDSEEWAGADQPALTLNMPGGGTGLGALFVMNDATTLYIALLAQYTGPAADLTVQFDASGDGQTLTNHDDAIGCNSSSKTARDTFRTATTAPSDSAPGYNGTIDVECNATKDAVATYVEISHPLDSGDHCGLATGCDIAVEPLDLLPFYAQIRLQSGSVDTYFPGSYDSVPPIDQVEAFIAITAPEPSGIAFASTALGSLAYLARRRS